MNYEPINHHQEQVWFARNVRRSLVKLSHPDPWKSGARNTTEGGGRKVNENKALTAKKTDFLHIASLGNVKFANHQCTRKDHIIAKVVLTKKEFAQCVENNCWKPRITARVPLDPLCVDRRRKYLLSGTVIVICQHGLETLQWFHAT
ncbi:hypothetical protein ScPMuIL_014144 [Solemya velum]